MEPYAIWMLIIGVSFFGAAWIPYLLRGKPLSFPIVCVAFGAIGFSLPLGIEAPDPVGSPELAERLTELVVILALMGVGLKLDRRVGWRRWSSTWRLLGVTMLLCIAAFALTGWYFLAMSPAAAVLLGAVLAPTDPVLAADVQTAPPQECDTGEVRFALTSESGLNDGLAFPFTNLALAIAAAAGGSQAWFETWLWTDLIYKVAVGLLAGVVVGYAMAWLVFRARIPSPVADTGEGIAAIAITLVSYSATELAGGYGFIAVFVTALVIRNYERDHEYHKAMHRVAEHVERLLMALVLVLFGGVLASGLLGALTWQAALAGLAFVFLVRPLAGLIGLVGMNISWCQRGAIAFFGIRGVGSFYYLAYALRRQHFDEAELMWSLVGFVVLVSIILHGVAATPVMRRIER